jgi:uncharacterized membrane protein YjjB (DUF3815 family)
MPAPLTLLLSCLIGTLGYALLTRIELRTLPTVTLLGVLCFALYELVFYLTRDLFLSSFLGALMASVAGYLLAILLRSPATMFYTPAIIPLVPGGRLYYTMYAAIKANGGDFLRYGRESLLIGLGIASGIILGVIAVRMTREALSFCRRRSRDENDNRRR